MSQRARRGAVFARRWGGVILAAAVIGGVAVAAGAGGDGSAARAAANVTITGRDFFWTPSTVTINVGDTVTWTNEQGFHNVILGDSQQNQPGFPTDPSWNPPPDETFNTPGSYTFFCEVHPGMTGTINVTGGEPTPTPTPTPTATPAVPPPGSGAPDTTPPSLTGVSVTGADGRARVRLTVSERATVNVRFAAGDEVATLRSQVQAGTWTLERPLANGRYAYELWAVDAMANRSVTFPGEVTVR
jgi:plastocyanin